MKIGYVNLEYNTRRNILNKCFPAEYVHVHSFQGLREKFQRTFHIGAFNRHSFAYWGGFPFPFEKIDLIHFWDSIAISPSKIPYITTFEAVVPRKFSNRFLQKGIDSLCSDQCRALIAFSESAKNQQFIFNKAHGISELNKKITVLLPPQVPLVTEQQILARSATTNNCLNFILVGKDLFRKGGAESVRALAKIRRYLPIQLYLVGDFNHIDYASSWEVDSQQEMLNFIESNSWIHYFESLPNSEVLELVKKCDVGLLPTRDDTFGYSVLEFQACGLPCITTDIRSLPEVNDNSIGWIIPVPKNCNRCADFSSKAKLKELSDTIQSGIEVSLAEILSNQRCIRAKGTAALKQIKERHSPIVFSKKLEALYHTALDNKG